MNSISHNPFRVLGVFANDPLKVRTANISRIRAFNKVGKGCEFDSDFKDIFGPVDRTEQAIEQAISQLSSDADVEFYSCLWIHRTPQLDLKAKAPIDIIQSGIGHNDKADIINVLVGATLADNYKLAAEYLVLLFECDDAPQESIKEKLIVSLGDDRDEVVEWFPISWWTQLKDYCISDSSHAKTLSIISKVFNRESMNYLRSITETVGKSESEIGIWALHTLAKSVIEVIKETCDLQTKEPNAEAQIVLSEYAAAILKFGKKYYEETRFWDAKPVEGLLEKLREIYRLSYSSKTKEECIEFGKRVKNEMQFLAPIEAKSFSAAIRKEIESFCSKPNETRWAQQLLRNCVAPLLEIKTMLGVGNPYYRRISTQIADDAIFACTSEIDSAVRKYNNPENDKGAAKDNLKKVLLQAEQLLVDIKELDLEREFFESRLNRFNEKIKNCSKQYGISVESITPTISLVTEDDTYKQCNDYYSLVEYVQSHPSSPHIQEAIQRIWKIEDAGFPLMGTSLPAYRKALLAYKEKYPNSHNEQKLLKEIEESLLGRTALGTVSDYQTMLRLWPNHPKKAIIQGRLELATFKLCHDVVSWEDYLKEYPNGQYREEALRLIKKAKEDVESDAFNRCVNIAGLNRFILKYPKSPLANKAAEKIEDMVYSQVVQTGKYYLYFRQYPNGRYFNDLNHLLDDECFNQCKTKSDYKKYLEKYPKGRHAKQAKDYIDKDNIRYYLLASFVLVIAIVVLIIIFSNGNSSSSNINTQSTTEITVPNKVIDLYDFLKNEGFSFMESESVFQEKLHNRKNIDDLYSFLQDRGYDFMGTLEAFEDTINNAMTHLSNQKNSSYSGSLTSAFFNFDSEFKYNSLATGAKPYKGSFGGEHTGRNYFKFKTSGSDDFVIIVKRHYDNYYINHIYIQGGDNAYLYVPDGIFDVYFYSGEGWNPYKEVGQFTGGFVTGTMQKDGPVELESAYMEYTLYPVAHGNLRLENENVNNVLR